MAGQFGATSGVHRSQPRLRHARGLEARVVLMNWRQVVIAPMGALIAATAGCGNTSTSPTPSTGIHKIQHIIVVMQENRSFDTYFGTFPGADGIPMQDGVPTACLP